MAEFRYRGREIHQEDILYIRTLIERYPNESRRKLSTRICEAWQWRQANGALRDMVCRGLLLMLERAGQIVLPPVSYVWPKRILYGHWQGESGPARKTGPPKRLNRGGFLATLVNRCFTTGGTIDFI
jgi:hypothetical protein